jgi:CheY-like chemotaxis protein
MCFWLETLSSLMYFKSIYNTLGNADDALNEIESQRYNLILLDIDMPGIDGTALYRCIRKIAKSLA